MASSVRGPPGVEVSKPVPPSPTLYCRNLNDKLPKNELRRELYMLFATYGVVLDIIALKTPKMRGQAHIVFQNAHASTQAMRALQGFDFFGKPMSITYAKGRSQTFAKLEGTYIQPAPEEPSAPGTQKTSVQEAVFGSAPAPMKAKPVNAPVEPAKGVKRGREEESEEDEDEEAAMDVSDSE